MMWPSLRTLLLLAVIFGAVSCRRQRLCDQGSCYPATGDLFIGRERNLYASSTCGVHDPERYCIVSHLEERTKCFTCDSRLPYGEGLHRDSHRIENIVSSFRDRKRRWWQAENGRQDVYIQLDLEAEFHFTHLIMTFKTFRPSAMLVERSYDFGKTWKVYRYFAYDCARSFPGVSRTNVRRLTDVICESRYSDVVPATEGEVIFRVLPPNIVIQDPYSIEVQDLLKLTNLRINFTELHTLGDDLLDNRPEIKEKYYYSMYDVTVRGSCSCYGHASRCVPLRGFPSRPDMVHGQCECTHNTKGMNCEMCEDFYNDLPWRPARGRQTNACKRCHCNKHAITCRFDAALYEASGRVSGGLCIDCQHNTRGASCQECMQFYYQDPNRDIRDPYICQHCDCDPGGSLYGGECEGRTDLALGTEAGRCSCKPYVMGRRCDTCRDGYWNMRDDNPYGCEECTCNTIGTVGNFGCDKYTGMCRCKRYVTGRSCDQCYPGFWGLSEQDPGGCKPCNCDIGGAISDECNQFDGHCQCRPNIIGLTCNQPAKGYFFPTLDFNIYEAEFAKGIGNTQLFVREPIPDRPQTWTGPGFMRITEGDSIEFTVDDIRLSMFYDIILRFEPQMPERWDDIRVTVVREGPTDRDGPCVNMIPQDDFKATSLQPGNRHVFVSPASCLETSVPYKIRIDFNRYKSDVATPEATVLIDSIVLIPSVDSIPIFQGPGEPERLREEFIYYRCREHQLGVIRGPLPDICKKHIFSISAVIHARALKCDCDPTGSLSRECRELGGKCDCKPNVIGRRCNQCAPGTYGFGPHGCQPCNCDPQGARDNNCEQLSGQCLCIPNAFGRTCDSCQHGYWNFPHCQQCDCNGNADSCHDQSGECIGCRDYTTGQNCERCVDSYYGDPRLSSRIPCRPCLCPGGPGSGYQHADTCRLDPRTQEMFCHCRPGFRGAKCDECLDNYYGNPVTPGGLCEPCVCNNNIDPDVPESCDGQTGECLKCLFNSEGFNCEYCVPGYYGDAVQQSCQVCICNELGTDTSVGSCDRTSGQCHCWPNVVGQRCDRCAEGHWNLASEQGCQACNCDLAGSTSTRCNEFTGQCQCIEGRGGLECNLCQDYYWGDPRHQCYPCNCNRQGSASYQCDRRTGQCDCIAGIDGAKCDRCARGTTGELPHCVPCGECFDSWDRVVRDLRYQTARMIANVNKTQTEGVAGVFEVEFSQLERQLLEIEQILANTASSHQTAQDLTDMLNGIQETLTASQESLNLVENEIINSIDRLENGKNRVESLRQQIDELRNKIQELRDKADNIFLGNVVGAYNETLQARARSRMAQQMVDGTEYTVRSSEHVRGQVDNLIQNSQDHFDEKMEKNEDELTDVNGEVSSLRAEITNINEMVCDGRGDPCDGLCGGGGCGVCGGLSCDRGAVTKATNALDFAKKAENLLKAKEGTASDLLTQVTEAKQDAEMAKSDAQAAYNVVLGAKNESEMARTMVQDMIDSITKFLKDDSASTDDIRQIAEAVLALSISLTPEQIQELVDQINEQIKKLGNVDDIISDTRDDIELARRLQDDANRASDEAKAILSTAEEVLNALNGSEIAQKLAESAIKQSNIDIFDAESDLEQIEREAGDGITESRTTLDKVNHLKQILMDLQKRFTENMFNIEKAEKEAISAANSAAKAEQDANTLESRFQGGADQLNRKYDMTKAAKERAQKLRDRASKLALSTQEKHGRLQSVTIEFESNEKLLIDMSDEIAALNDRMVEYLSDIRDKSENYRNCEAGS